MKNTVHTAAAKTTIASGVMLIGFGVVIANNLATDDVLTDVTKVAMVMATFTLMLMLIATAVWIWTDETLDPAPRGRVDVALPSFVYRAKLRDFTDGQVALEVLRMRSLAQSCVNRYGQLDATVGMMLTQAEAEAEFRHEERTASPARR